jgi:hypothetical protein
MTTSYQGIPVAKAGERFGLSQEDLEELFQMREGGEEQMGDEFNLPLTQVQFTEKGRGGALGYKAARTPTVTKTLGSAERNAVNISNIFSPTNTVGGQQQQPKLEEKLPERLPTTQALRGFIGAEGDPTKNILGLSAISRALESGMTAEQIRASAEKEGVGFGPEASKLLGTTPAQQYLSQYIGQGGTSGTLGLSAVEKARQAGLSDAEIRTFATAQNLNFGPSAQQSFGTAAPTPAPSYSAPAPSSTNLSSFVGSGGTSGALGLEAVNRARSSGLSDSQIRQMASQQGLTLGGAAAASLR